MWRSILVLLVLASTYVYEMLKHWYCSLYIGVIGHMRLLVWIRNSYVCLHSTSSYYIGLWVRVLGYLIVIFMISKPYLIKQIAVRWFLGQFGEHELQELRGSLYIILEQVVPIHTQGVWYRYRMTHTQKGCLVLVSVLKRFMARFYLF